MTEQHEPIDPADERILAMLERRIGRGLALGATLGERARAAARRDGRSANERSLPSIVAGRARHRAPGATRMATASIAGTLIVAVGLLAALVLRPQGSSPPASPSDRGPLRGSPSSASSRPPVAPWESITWRLAGKREVVFGGGSGTYMVDAVPWLDGVVAIGYEISGGGTTGRVWRSADGTDWREVRGAGPPFDGISMDRVLALGDRLVIRGRDRSRALKDHEGPLVAFESEDGERWTAVTDAASPWLREGLVTAASGGGSILAVEAGDEGRLWRSNDGGTWESTPVSEVFPRAVISSLAWTGDRWLVGGVVGEQPQTFRQSWGTGAVWFSPDGVHWTSASINAPEASMGPFAIGRDGIVAIAGRTGGGAIILRESLWRSPDGSTWTPLAFDNFQLQLVADGERIVALDQLDDRRLRVRESFDGATWRELEVLALGRFVPDDPGTLDGIDFPGNSYFPVLTPNGVWRLGQAIGSPVGAGHEYIELELRWFGAARRLPEAFPFPSRPLPGSNDIPCLPAGQECG